MTIGLRVRHPTSGAVLLDTTTGMSRILGSVDTVANTAGSVTNITGFNSGTPFAVSYAQGVPDIEQSQTFPVHSISGTTLSWNGAALTCKIIYGVYAGTTAGKVGSGLIGFRALNGNQATQIDSLYANHCLLSTGSLSIVAGGYQTITVTASMPLLAYRGTGWVTVLEKKSNGDGTWTIVVGTGPVAASGTYYIFDVVGSASQMYSTNIGLRIRHPTTGAVLYDSRMKYMRIVTVRANGADGYVPTSPQTTTLTQDNLAAVVDPGLWYNQTVRQDIDTDGNVQYTDVYSPYFVGAGVSGTTLTEGSVSVGSDSPILPGDVQQGTTILVDVSNF